MVVYSYNITPHTDQRNGIPLRRAALCASTMLAALAYCRVNLDMLTFHAASVAFPSPRTAPAFCLRGGNGLGLNQMQPNQPTKSDEIPAHVLFSLRSSQLPRPKSATCPHDRGRFFARSALAVLICAMLVIADLPCGLHRPNLHMALAATADENGNKPVTADYIYRESVRVQKGDILDQSLSLIEEEYPGDVNVQRLKREAARAAFESLRDPYTKLLNENEVDPLLRASALAAEAPPPGIGLAVVKDSQFPNFLTITAVFDGGPAQRVGLRTGDRIEAVFGVKVSAGTSLPQLARRISTEEEAVLSIRRPGLPEVVSGVKVPARQMAARPRSLALSFSRDLNLLARNRPSNVQQGLKREVKERGGRLVYAKLSDMGADSADELLEALLDQFGQPLPQQQDGDNTARHSALPEALVLDLRDNPGGLLTAGIDISAILVRYGQPCVACTCVLRV